MQIRNTLVAGALAIAALAAAVPAQAAGPAVTLEFGTPHHGPNFGYGRRGHDRDVGRHMLSPREVRGILRANGFRQIRFVDRRGPVYQARAENRRGRDVLVTVSARSGNIINVDRAGRGRHR